MTDPTPACLRRHEARSAESASQPSIAVIGAAGFVGSASLRALTASCDVKTTAVVRQQPLVPDPRVRYMIADTTDLRSLTRALEGVDVVVHAASYTGADVGLSESINYIGTQNVLQASSIQAIERVINVSTIGVYGAGPFNDIVEDAREPNPVTTLSATKAAADNLVRSHGGTTVRPGFVYGPGDRWFLPGLRSILEATQGWVEDGRALLSVISVDELGALIAELARSCTTDDQGVLYHAAEPDPRTVYGIASQLAGNGFALPNRSYTYLEALSHADDLGLTGRQIDLVGRDHWINASRLWARTGRTPSAGVPAADAPKRDCGCGGGCGETITEHSVLSSESGSKVL